MWIAVKLGGGRMPETLPQSTLLGRWGFGHSNPAGTARPLILPFANAILPLILGRRGYLK